MDRKRLLSGKPIKPAMGQGKVCPIKKKAVKIPIFQEYSAVIPQKSGFFST